MKNKKVISSWKFVLALIFFTGCGKSSNSSTSSTKTITFTPSGAPSDNSVYLEEVITNNDEITLMVKVKGGANIYGTAMELNFDPGKIGYVLGSGSEGIYFNQGVPGTTTFSSEPERDTNNVVLDNGVLLIGINRQGVDSEVSGDGILCQIVLKALVEQTDTPVSFNTSNSSLYDSAKVSKGNSWIGGSLSYK